MVWGFRSFLVLYVRRPYVQVRHVQNLLRGRVKTKSDVLTDVLDANLNGAVPEVPDRRKSGSVKSLYVVENSRYLFLRQLFQIGVQNVCQYVGLGFDAPRCTPIWDLRNGPESVPACLLSSPGGNDSYDTISIKRPRADSLLQLRHVNLKFIFDIPLLAEVIAHYALIVS